MNASFLFIDLKTCLRRLRTHLKTCMSRRKPHKPFANIPTKQC